MNTKSLLLSLLGVVLLGFFFSYSLVFALPYTQKSEYRIQYLSDNILIDSNSLQHNMGIIHTTQKIQNFSLTADCGGYGKILSSRGDYTLFKIGFLDTKCTKKQIQVAVQINNYNSLSNFHIISEKGLYDMHLDRSDNNIEHLVSTLGKQIEVLKQEDISGAEKLQQTRKIQEYTYMKGFLEHIQTKRKQKYKIPVAGASYPTNTSKVPDAARPYRRAYTDGIHHGWDFDGEMGDSVIALDDGIIIRVVDGFLFSDLGELKKEGKLSYEDKIKNLDILRGNQVWVKTMKGDVAFYSHLDTVFPDIKVGDMVKRGQPLGTMGITGVPDKNYTDYHLHIAIQKNPYLNSKIGKNTAMDYMMWDWSFKGKGVNYALKYKKELFTP